MGRACIGVLDRNASGQVTGWSWTTGRKAFHAFLWTPTAPNGMAGTMSDLGTLGVSSVGNDTNASGQVVGNFYPTGGPATWAFLYTSDSGMVDLNMLIDPLSGWELTQARGINDAGQITGYGYTYGGIHAFLLTPVPEPSAIFLLSYALAAIFAMRLAKFLHRSRVLQLAAALFPLVAFASAARADIFQWEHISPADPSQGKQQSTTLCPDGASLDAAPGANLEFRDLTMAYLIGADLTGAYGGYPNLTNADLSRANLTNASFYGATLTAADFTGAEVRGASLGGGHSAFDPAGYGINLSQLYSTASYRAHDLSGIGLGGSDLAGGNFAGQNLTDASFSGAMLTGADFTDADVRNVDFSKYYFFLGQFSGYVGTGVSPAQLSSTANYRARELSGISVEANNLAGANFAGQRW